jgi:predicted AlkP superfamily phosphohydrolase/phosphomutase
MSEKRLKCIVLNDPVTFPPEPLNGITTTGMMTPPGSRNWIYPHDMLREVDSIAGGYECDVPPDFDVVASKNPDRALRIVEVITQKLFRVSRYLAENYEWDALAIIFTTSDRLQHYWWHDQDRIAEYYKTVDTMLGEYCKYAKRAGADLIVVSDHGFGPAKQVFLVNRWLESAGLTSYSKSLFSKGMSGLGLSKTQITRRWPSWPILFSRLPHVLQLGIRKVLPQDEAFVNMRRSSALAKTQLGVFVTKPKDIELVANMLRQATDETGSRVFEKVFYSREVLNGPYVYRAPELFLQPFDSYDISLSKQASLSLRTGTHRPQGIMIYCNSTSDRPGRILDPVRPWDVAASILEIFSLPIPDYFDGKPKILPT